MQSLKKLETDETALVRDNSALKILESINWDFSHNTLVSPNDIVPFNCRKYHWYPGTFIPQIPFTLIEVLSLPNATVFDPFSGIGTTFFQALSLMRIPIGVEICTVAVNLCKSMLLLFDPKINLIDMKEDIQNSIGEYVTNIDYSKKVLSNIQIEKLRPWYEQETFNRLCFLFCKEEEAESPYIQGTMRIVISSILKSVCNQDRGWGCIADNMLPKADQIKQRDVFGNFRKSLNVLFNDLFLHKKTHDCDYQAFYDAFSKQESIFHCDVRKAGFIKKASVDLVITSPPYANMIDYATSQRLSYYYMGASIPEDSGIEIGARNKRKRKDALARYVEDMQEVNKLISDSLKTSGYACYIMPSFNTDNVKNHDRKKVIDSIMASMEGIGLKLVAEFDRVVSNKRRDHNSKWTSLEQEKIYIYRKA